ncbi:TPM domain-containing protein [Corallococcus interemptor]|uniref:TPM domain-containing protein n=1 Tax=Corallococcus interemptor TaxID=2316720 RepID=UPI003D08B20E
MVKSLLLTLLLLPALVLAGVPSITRPVTDPSGMLTAPETEAVSQALVDLRATKQVQMAVLLVETTDGQPIDDYAEAVFRQWKGGEAGRDNGVLLVIARGDRRSRLEVGYGLEASLTDGEATALLHAQGPLLREGRLESALLAIIAGVRVQVSPDALPGPGARAPSWTPFESGLFFMALVMTACVVARLLLQLQGSGLGDTKNSVVAALMVALPPATLVAIGWSGPRSPVFILGVYGVLLGLFFWGWSLLQRKRTVRGLLLIILPLWIALVGQVLSPGPIRNLSDFLDWSMQALFCSMTAAFPFLFVGLPVYWKFRHGSHKDWAVSTSSSSSDWSSSSSYSSDSSSSSSSSDWSGGGGSSGGGGGSDSW